MSAVRNPGTLYLESFLKEVGKDSKHVFYSGQKGLRPICLPKEMPHPKTAKEIMLLANDFNIAYLPPIAINGSDISIVTGLMGTSDTYFLDDIEANLEDMRLWIDSLYRAVVYAVRLGDPEASLFFKRRGNDDNIPMWFSPGFEPNCDDLAKLSNDLLVSSSSFYYVLENPEQAEQLSAILAREAAALRRKDLIKQSLSTTAKLRVELAASPDLPAMLDLLSTTSVSSESSPEPEEKKIEKAKKQVRFHLSQSSPNSSDEERPGQGPALKVKR